MNTTLPELKLVATDIAMGESPRWHQGRLWFSDWGAQQIVAIDAAGAKETLPVPFALPFCFDWLPDGRMLVVAGRENRVIVLASDGSLQTHADLAPISTSVWNEIVIDSRGHAYVNSSEAIALISPDGTNRKVAEGGAFPNGMAITADNRTLILAESHGKCLTAFDISSDGSLSNRRLWAQLNGPPDGICMDNENAVWYADVPNKCCIRVLEGGVILETIRLTLGCFACLLGGENNKTLYIVANEWRGMDKIAEVAAARTGKVFAIDAPAPRAGWPSN